MSTKTTRQGGVIFKSPMMQTLPELSALPLSEEEGKKKLVFLPVKVCWFSSPLSWEFLELQTWKYGDGSQFRN